MICLNPSTILALSDDGSKVAFDSELTQAKIAESCAKAGMKDAWLAEDLANAVESALAFQAEKGILFSEREINSSVAQILEDAGFANVAKAFRKANISADAAELTLEKVKEILGRRLGANDSELEPLARKVMSACAKIGLKNAPLSLTLELARFYRGAGAGAPALQLAAVNNISASPFALSGRQIAGLLSERASSMAELGIIRVDGVSCLFPAIKISLNLGPLAASHNLKPLITELSLCQCFESAASVVDDAISAVLAKLASVKEIADPDSLPIYLKFADIHRFAGEYFGVRLSESEKFCEDLARSFAENLRRPAVLKGLRFGGPKLGGA